jgi:uncharacterized membrane protein YeaQ/YmgE (transglycosylase-associated protein family)
MDGYSLLALLVIGTLAGWIAGLITRGHGAGIIMNCVTGVFGAILGNMVFNRLGIAQAGLLGLLISAIIGAVILILVVALIRKAVK